MSTAVELLRIAKAKERKLTTKERRHLITWLQATGGDGDELGSYTNVQLGEFFGVSERTIRVDKLAFRKEKANFIRNDDISLIIADIAIDVERQVRDIEKSKRKATLGTTAYLKHCTDAMTLRLQTIKALQDLGYYPKNLGQLTVTKWDFISSVDKVTGHVNTEQVDNLPILEAEFAEQPRLEQGSENVPTIFNREQTGEGIIVRECAASADTCEIGITSGPSETV